MSIDIHFLFLENVTWHFGFEVERRLMPCNLECGGHPRTDPTWMSAWVDVMSFVYSQLRSFITPIGTKVHVILQSFVVLTWMRDTSELV
jgi:hypothetical protein